MVLQTQIIAEIIPVKFNGPWGGVQQFRWLPLGMPKTVQRFFQLLVSPAFVSKDPLFEYLIELWPIQEPLTLWNPTYVGLFTVPARTSGNIKEIP